MTTSDMWVTHGERKKAKLRDPLSSRKTPKASGATGHTPSGKLGSGSRSPMWSDWHWHKPRAWAATEESPYPFPPHQGRSVREEGGQSRGPGWRRARAGDPPPAPRLAAPWGFWGCVLPGPRRAQGFRAEGSGPGPAGVNLQQAGTPPPTHPPPPTAAGRSAASRVGRLGSPLRYGPRSLAAAAAAVPAAAGHPPPQLLCQPPLLLLPPPPPPRPHRSHRRCGDYCSAR